MSKRRSLFSSFSLVCLELWYLATVNFTYVNSKAIVYNIIIFIKKEFFSAYANHDTLSTQDLFKNEILRIFYFNYRRNKLKKII